jgi:glycosyltransferase involved in cell wall biosynthesis
MKKPIVFDFDDAIFLANTSGHNVYIERFKNPGKIAQILKMSKRIIAGNEYLLQYACRYNKNAIMIPSSVDTERYRPVHMNKAGKDEVVIGWVGSETTKIFLYPLEDTFQELEKRYKNIIFKIVGASFYSSRVKNVVNKNWRLEDEVLDLQSFDIGIMPMPDDEWTRGKCGFKAILYMACGIPVVASPVGVNTDIVEDGISGFFAKSTEEWVEKISVLIEDKALRESMGMRGREKIMAEYSLASNAPLFYETLKQAIDAKGAA